MKRRLQKKIQDSKTKINYQIKNVEERLKIVEEILGDQELQDYLDLYYWGEVAETIYDDSDEYAQEYIDELDSEKLIMFNAHPRCAVADQIHTADKLSDGDFVSRFLEQLSNYIIYVGGTKEEIKQYKFEKDKVSTETKINCPNDMLRHDGSTQAKRDQAVLNKTSSDLNGEAPDFEGNYKKTIKQEITKEDIEKSEILQEYHDFRVKIGNKKRSGELDGKPNKYYLINKINRTLSTTKDDMIYIKNSEFGTIYFREPLADDGQSKSSFILTDDWTYEDIKRNNLIADFFNPEHYSLILRILPFYELSDNLKKIDKKFNMLETKLNLTEDKSKMLEVLKDGKKTKMYSLFLSSKDFKSKRECLIRCKQALYDTSSLADKLGWTYAKTKGLFDRLCKDCYEAFIEMYESEFYYMSIVKGKYKKCNNCNNIKLIQKFNVQKKSKDGYENICKECKRIYDKNRQIKL